MGLASIDLALAEQSTTGEERKRLRRASLETGAFLLSGHGIEQQIGTSLLALSRRFFGLPQAERDAIDMMRSPYFRGYSAAGSERTQGRPDVREQLDVGPEESAVLVAPGDPLYMRLHGPNLWPSSLPELRQAVLAWMELLRGVSTRLLVAIVESIGLPGDALAGGFSGCPHERLKIIRYPPAEGTTAQQGVGEHSDSGFLTLILQDGTRGLQVHDGGTFADVRAPNGELIVILGRALQDATGGGSAAPIHRVTSPSAGDERTSVSYFLNPRLDYAGYGYEALKVLFRSHPEPAQKFFGDVLL